MSELIKNTPIVFAVGNDYKIFVPVNDCSLMWVKVGDECFYDDSNGVLRSAVSVHKMSVPMEILDRERKYTICYRRVVERKPYFSNVTNVEEISFDFYPLPEDNYNVYHISDTHGMVDQPVAAAKNFEKEYGKIDLLILNGDIIDHSGDLNNFNTIYEISSLITSGNIPVVFSRGNHDTRGIYAEAIANYTPTRDGCSYFSFRLGTLWGLVVDCGEDKDDSHEEYGNTMCCHDFRKRETRYLEHLVENAKNEYMAEGIKRKLIVVHSPFTKIFKPPFDIEQDTYRYWTQIMREYIKPELIICGHTHKRRISLPGDEFDSHGQPCPVIVAAEPNKGSLHFTGGGFIFGQNNTKFVYTSDIQIESEHILPKGEQK